MTFEAPAVHFCREQPLRGGKTIRGDTLHIHVPRGHEEEAAQLVQRFRTEVIEVREQAQQRLMNPPEPV